MTYGVAQNANLHDFRVLNSQGSGTYSGIIAAIDEVVAHPAQYKVINLSLGGGSNTAMDNAVNGAVAAGVVVVAAAGNDTGDDACNYSPAGAADAITVGSTTSSDSRSSFSNIGTCVDIFAPGSSITSAAWGGGTRVLSGTSMATPHVGT